MKVEAKFAKIGKSVFSSDVRDFNLNTDYKILKVDLSGGGTIDVAAGDTENLIINHNLGYNPLILFYWGIAGNNNKQLAFSLVGLADDQCWIDNLQADKNNIYVYFYASAGGGQTFDYYYYLFYDEGIND